MPGVVKRMGSVGDYSWPGASGTVRWQNRYPINTMAYQALDQ